MTIERVNVHGRAGTAAYLTSAFEPSEPDIADMVKIIFDDGAVMFAMFDDDTELAQDYSPDQPRDPKGVATGGQWTAANHYGLVPGDVEKFKKLKADWARINSDLLDHIDSPDGPEARGLVKQLEAVVQSMQTLRADPGTPAGIGLPGGPRDVTIIGAGPGGLTASINGAAEGLDTLVVEANAVVGGQAKFSSRIENFPGFPVGVTGERLTQQMYGQAQRLGASVKLGVRVTGMVADEATGMKHLTMSDGTTIDSRTVILAGGVEFRRMDFPGSEGSGVFVGDGKALAAAGKGGDVLVIGGSNGAAQAALGCAQTAKHVYLMARRSITESMSDYQVVAVRNKSNITVIEGDSVSKLNRDDQGRPVSVETARGNTIKVDCVGGFLGSLPDTKWLPDQLIRSKDGKIVADKDFKTSIPGVYVIGDMRAGAIGRVGVAVGEGQFSLREANVFLDDMRKTATETAHA